MDKAGVFLQSLSQKYYQKKLRRSLLSKDTTKFKETLKHGDVNLRHPDYKYTVFELACKTSGCEEFIKECGKNQPNLTEIHPVEKMSPIHFAALSYDKNNIEALLSLDKYQSINIDQFYEDRTALYLLCQAVGRNQSDNGKLFESIKYLLGKGANINATCVNGIPALWHLLTGSDNLMDEKRQILNASNCNVNLWNGELKEKIIEKIPELQLVEYKHPKNESDFIKLKDILIYGDEQTFIDMVNENQQYNSNRPEKLNIEEIQQLVKSAVHKKKLESVKHLLQNTLRDEKMQPDLFYTVLDLCYRTKNESLFQFVLEQKPNNHSALSRVLKTQTTLFDDQEHFLSFDKLVDQFAESIEQPDKLSGRTALFYAIIRRNEPAQLTLLAKGAHLGAKDFQGVTPLCNIKLDLLERHLDSCVTTEKMTEKNVDDEEIKLKINLSNFNAREGDQNTESELYPLVQLAHRLTSNSILEHPVIASILTLKRKDLCFFRIFYFLYHFAHFMVYVALLVMRDSELLANYKWLLDLAICHLILRFIICLSIDIITPNAHVGHKDISQIAAKFIQLFLIPIFFVVRLLPDYPEFVHRVAPAIGLLLIGIEATFVLVKFPWLSCASNIIMITTVLFSYCKALLPFSFILAVFAFIFHIVFKTNLSNNTDNQLNTFETYQVAILKTIVMTTGEFDTSNIKPEESWAKYIFFLMFLLFVYIPFSNFISSLAVDDTTKLRAVANIITFQQEVTLMHRLENIKLLVCVQLRKLTRKEKINEPSLMHRPEEKKFLSESNNSTSEKLGNPSGWFNVQRLPKEATSKEKLTNVMNRNFAINL